MFPAHRLTTMPDHQISAAPPRRRAASPIPQIHLQTIGLGNCDGGQLIAVDDETPVGRKSKRSDSLTGALAIHTAFACCSAEGRESAPAPPPAPNYNFSH